jgi:hypothetical protein
MPQPLAPLAPLQPLTPLQPMAPLPRRQPLTPMSPLPPGGSRPALVPTGQYDRYDGASLATLPAPTPAYEPPPVQQPQVVNLGLSQTLPFPNWGGMPTPTVPNWGGTPQQRFPVPARRPAGNKAAGFVVGAVALLVAMGAGGLFKSSSDGGSHVSVPPISVSIPPISIGSKGSGATGRHQPAIPEPAHESGRTLDINGNIDGQTIRVTFLRLVDNAAPKDTFMDSPDAGKRLVAAQFRVKNIGSFIYVASATSAARVVDTKGHTYKSQFLFDDLRQGKVFDGVINVDTGESSVGYVAFEVPKHAKIKKVEFSASSSGGQTGTWTFVRP